MPNPVAWNDIEIGLENMTAVEGGFSQARRGLVSLPGGEQVFVKIGTDENSKEWAKKEIAVYRFLKTCSYPAIPELLSTNPDETAFALEALTSGNGWDWSDTWTAERLAATLKAMDELAGLRPIGEDWISMGQLALDASRDGWSPLAQTPELQQTLLNKLRAAERADIAESLNFDEQAGRSSRLVFHDNELVHYDVRADNCAWNPATKQVKLVDWNWTQMGDLRFDTSAMLVHVQRAGFDVLPAQAARLDAGALQWMAGFWFKAASTPIWPGGPPHLRDFQLQSGITAFDLVDRT